MSPSFHNHYKLFRSGYLTESNLSKKMEGEVNWLLNQLLDEVKVKLLKFRPELVKEFEDEIFGANDFRYNSHYRKCQISLRKCHQLLLGIKMTLRAVDWYLDTFKTYEKIEKNILIHSSIQLPSIKLFKQYLEKAKEEIKEGRLKKARLFLSVGSGELEEFLQTQKNDDLKNNALKTKSIELVKLIKSTELWAKEIPLSLRMSTVEKVVAAIYIFIEDRKYILAERLLEDLSVQIYPRKSFLEEWKRIKRLIPQESIHSEKEMKSILQKEGWSKATNFLLSKTSNHINLEIKNIQIH